MVDRVEQRFAALDRANEIRFANARLKERIAALSSRDGALELAGLLEREDRSVAALRVRDALRAVRRLGESSATKMRVRAGGRVAPVPDALMLRDLTSRQRDALVVELRMFAARCGL